MSINVPIKDKTATDITNLIRKSGTSVSNTVVREALDDMVKEGLVVTKPHPKFSGRLTYSF